MRQGGGTGARWGSSRLLASAVLVLLVIVSVAASFGARALAQRQQRNLLRERASVVSLILTQAIESLRGTLPVLGELGAPGHADHAFARAARPLVAQGAAAVGVATVDGGRAEVAASVGRGPAAGDRLTGRLAQTVRRASTSRDLVTSLRGAGRGRVLVVALRAPHGRVVYEESVIRSQPQGADATGSPFKDLAVALYAGPRAVPSQLIFATPGAGLARKPVDRRLVSVGLDHWLLVTAAVHPLGASITTILPWAVLAAGLVGALLAAGLVHVLTRRRAYAWHVAEQRTTELRAALAERERLELAERDARREAEAANHAKSEFLSRMSHELRTPLNAIIGFGQLLELEAPNETQRESIDHILKGGRHLLALINEILDISRIETGNLPLSVEPVMLGDLVADAVSMIRPMAEERGVRVFTDLGELGEAHVRADRQRLKQVLLNLLSNAIKYNRSEGVVHVRAGVAGADRVQLVVQDQGGGIDPERLTRLFQPFERLGAEASEVEGTGLGLALSRGLVELMGGTITAESEVGVGSRFVVELAAVDAPAPRGTTDEFAVPRSSVALPAAQILYIEDNLSNVRLVERVLAKEPHVRLLPAMQGRLGLELARRHHPDLILLDLHLPDMTGSEVLEQLQADDETRSIPVVVLSADATQRQVEKLRGAGASGYLTKPLDVREFLEAVHGVLDAVRV